MAQKSSCRRSSEIDPILLLFSSSVDLQNMCFTVDGKQCINRATTLRGISRNRASRIKPYRAHAIANPMKIPATMYGEICCRHSEQFLDTIGFRVTVARFARTSSAP